MTGSIFRLKPEATPIECVGWILRLKPEATHIESVASGFSRKIGWPRQRFATLSAMTRSLTASSTSRVIRGLLFDFDDASVLNATT